MRAEDFLKLSKEEQNALIVLLPTPESSHSPTKAPAAAILLRGNNVGIKAIKAELLTPPAKPTASRAPCPPAPAWRVPRLWPWSVPCVVRQAWPQRWQQQVQQRQPLWLQPVRPPQGQAQRPGLAP